MDLIELRILAVTGILFVGILASALTVSAAAAIEWAGRVFHARRMRFQGEQAVTRSAGYDPGRARC
jgi:hypothetical protein